MQALRGEREQADMWTQVSTAHILVPGLQWCPSLHKDLDSVVVEVLCSVMKSCVAVIVHCPQVCSHGNEESHWVVTAVCSDRGLHQSSATLCVTGVDVLLEHGREGGREGGREEGGRREGGMKREGGGGRAAVTNLARQIYHSNVQREIFALFTVEVPSYK